MPYQNLWIKPELDLLWHSYTSERAKCATYVSLMIMDLGEIVMQVYGFVMHFKVLYVRVWQWCIMVTQHEKQAKSVNLFYWNCLHMAIGELVMAQHGSTAEELG